MVDVMCRLILFLFVNLIWSCSVSESVRNGPSNTFGDPPQDNCRKAKKPCQPLQFSTCFGVKLPYSFTSNELVNENFTQHQLQNEMKRWEGLRSAPKCWSVIQPLLCAVYMPKCQDDIIELPPQELCRIAKKPCAVIEKAMKEWPEILKCEDSAQCKNNDLRSVIGFNTSAKCMEPLKEVTNSFNYYEGFEGCALNCSNPLFSEEEHETVSRLIKWLGILSGGANLFVIATFIIDWKSAKQYPSVTLFYVNCWYAVATLGWMLQFLPNTKEDIVCRKDSTIRRNEPASGENMFCPMSFFFIYFGVMSSLAWLCVFAYVWNLTCNAVGRIRERIDKKKVYFGVFAFLAPLVLTIICLSIGKVDGSSISGVCFVGINDSTARLLLLVAPLVAASVFTVGFLWRGMYRLLSVSLSSSDFISDKGRKEIKSQATRVLIFSLGMIIVVVSSLFFQIHLMNAKPVWEKSLEEHIICKMNLLDTDTECEHSEKADVTLVIGDVLMFFLGGIIVSSWAWTGATIRTWGRKIKRKCGTSEEQGDRTRGPSMKKHQLISQAYEKRHQIRDKGRLSLSLQSTHNDPMGLNKLLDPTHLCKEDLEQSQQLNHTNTGTDTDINSEWAAALPHVVLRRGALIPPHSSNSVSCLSEDNSRRPSCDSAMSDLAARNFQGSGSIYKKSSYRNWFSRRHSGKGGIRYPWRRGAGGSSSSLESNPGSQILPAITALINKNQQKPTMLNNAVNGGGDIDMVPMNGNGLQPKKALLVSELGTQTSFEWLPTSSRHTISVCEKATQSSLVSLHEIGTQTKKSATKKKEKKDKGPGGGSKKGSKEDTHRYHPEDKGNSAKEDEEEEAEDPVSKLLTPI